MAGPRSGEPCREFHDASIRVCSQRNIVRLGVAVRQRKGHYAAVSLCRRILLSPILKLRRIFQDKPICARTQQIRRRPAKSLLIPGQRFALSSVAV